MFFTDFVSVPIIGWNHTRILTSPIEAAIAAGQEGDSLLTVNQTLAQRISDYKKAAGHCKKHAPKAKPKASAKSAATPPEP